MTTFKLLVEAVLKITQSVSFEVTPLRQMSIRYWPKANAIRRQTRFRCGVLFVALWMTVAGDAFAQPTDSPADTSGIQIQGGQTTPSDVYARLEFLNRCLDRLMVAQQLPETEPPYHGETKLGPLHVYQMVLACCNQVQQLSDNVGVLAIPTLSARPREYEPRDVLFLVDLMVDSVLRIAAKLNVNDLPAAGSTVAGKTPTDVFLLATDAFGKLHLLCGYDELSTDDAFAEMVRVHADVKSILQQADPECRYRVDVPVSDEILEVSDIYKKCLDVRRLLNLHRVALGQPEVPLPKALPDDQISTYDVFVQTQIMIAELTFLKLQTKTVSSTPLAIPVDRTKASSDVYQEASLIEYLLRQVRTGADTGFQANQ